MTFRRILKERNNVGETNLYDVLEKIYDSSIATWIPAGSSENSVPHIKSVEMNVDRLMPQDIKKSINSAEIFILLASVLLHDLGRIDEKSECHAALSCKIIQENWSRLSIPNTEYARWIAAVCCAHSWDKPDTNRFICTDDISKECGLKCPRRNESDNSYLNELGLIHDSEYGQIRLNWIAALLRIADELDNSVNRSFPDWLTNYINYHEKNNWRHLIKSVNFDPVGQCIKLCTQEDSKWNVKTGGKTQIEWCLDALKKANDVLSGWSDALKSIGINYSQIVVEVCDPLPELYTCHEDTTEETIDRWSDCRRFIEPPIEAKHFDLILKAMSRIRNGIIERESYTWAELAVESGIRDLSFVKLIATRLISILKNCNGDFHKYGSSQKSVLYELKRSGQSGFPLR